MTLNTSVDGSKIGCIRLKQFNANASREMRDAIQDPRIRSYRMRP